jgi:hypothetical protein
VYDARGDSDVVKTIIDGICEAGEKAVVGG